MIPPSSNLGAGKEWLPNSERPALSDSPCRTAAVLGAVLRAPRKMTIDTECTTHLLDIVERWHCTTAGGSKTVIFHPLTSQNALERFLCSSGLGLGKLGKWGWAIDFFQARPLRNTASNFRNFRCRTRQSQPLCYEAERVGTIAQRRNSVRQTIMFYLLTTNCRATIEKWFTFWISFDDVFNKGSTEFVDGFVVGPLQCLNSSLYDWDDTGS